MKITIYDLRFTILFGLITLLLQTSALAQPTVLGRSTNDQFTAGFFLHWSNADAVVRGVNQNGSVPFAPAVAPGTPAAAGSNMVMRVVNGTNTFDALVTAGAGTPNAVKSNSPSILVTATNIGGTNVSFVDVNPTVIGAKLNSVNGQATNLSLFGVDGDSPPLTLHGTFEQPLTSWYDGNGNLLASIDEFGFFTAAGISGLVEAFIPTPKVRSESISRATFNTNVTQTGSKSIIAGFPYRLDVSGNVVGLVCSTNLIFMTVTNGVPTPRHTNFLDGAAADIVGNGSFFYVIAGDIKVFDVVTPAAPVLVTNLPYGGMNKSRIQDGLLISANSSGNVTICSVKNPALPVLLSSMDMADGADVEDAVKSGDVLYVADYSGQNLKVYDISNPRSPVLISSQSATAHGDADPFEPWRLMIKGNVLYVADDGWLQIFSIVDRTNPVFVSTINIPGADVEGMQLIDDTLIWSTADGVSFLDVQDPFNPVIFATSATAALWVAADRDYVYSAQNNALHVSNMPKLPRFGTDTSVLLVNITNSVRLPLASNNVGRVVTVIVDGNVTNTITTLASDFLGTAATQMATNGQAFSFVASATNWNRLYKPSLDASNAINIVVTSNSIAPAVTAGTNGLDSIAARAAALTIVSNQSVTVSNTFAGSNYVNSSSMNTASNALLTASAAALTIVSNQSVTVSNTFAGSNYVNLSLLSTTSNALVSVGGGASVAALTIVSNQSVTVSNTFAGSNYVNSSAMNTASNALLTAAATALNIVSNQSLAVSNAIGAAVTAGTNGLDSIAARAAALTIVSNQSLAVSNSIGSLAPTNTPTVSNPSINGDIIMLGGSVGTGSADGRIRLTNAITLGGTAFGAAVRIIGRTNDDSRSIYAGINAIGLGVPIIGTSGGQLWVFSADGNVTLRSGSTTMADFSTTRATMSVALAASLGTYFPSNTLTMATVVANITNNGGWKGMISNCLMSVTMSNNAATWKQENP